MLSVIVPRTILILHPFSNHLHLPISLARILLPGVRVVGSDRYSFRLELMV